MNEVLPILSMLEVASAFLIYGCVLNLALIALPRLVYFSITGKYPTWRAKTRWEKMRERREGTQKKTSAVKVQQFYSK